LARQLGLFILMCLIWGNTWVGMRAGVSAVPPLFFAGTRFVAAGVILMLWHARMGRSPRAAC
jgi:drug/metabolite transporter (DMT)-like permease